MDNPASPNLQQLGSAFQPGFQPISDSQPQPASDPASVADANEIFSQIVKRIIEQQEAIIGPIAVEQARQIEELEINWPQHTVKITGNPRQVIDTLVAKYKELFGQIAVQVSREAVAGILTQLPPDQQPESLTKK